MLTFAKLPVHRLNRKMTLVLWNQELILLKQRSQKLKTELAPGLAVLMNQNYDHLKTGGGHQ